MQAVMSLTQNLMNLGARLVATRAAQGGAILVLLALGSAPVRANDYNMTVFNRNILVESGKCQGCNLRGNDLRSLDLSDADLRGADLRETLVTRARLRRANLTGADLRGAFLWGADLQDAVLDGANLCGAIMPTGARSDIGCVEPVAASLPPSDPLPPAEAPPSESQPSLPSSPVVMRPAAAIGRTVILALDPVTRAASARGAIVLGTRDRWAIDARPGTMRVTLRSREGNARFDAVAPDGRTLVREASRTTISVPRDGRYEIVVGSTRGNAEYQLIVTFE